MSRLPAPIANVAMAQNVKPPRRLRIHFIFVPRFSQKTAVSNGDWHEAVALPSRRRSPSSTNCPFDNHTDCPKTSHDSSPLLVSTVCPPSQRCLPKMTGEKFHEVQAMYQRTKGSEIAGRMRTNVEIAPFESHVAVFKSDASVLTAFPIRSSRAEERGERANKDGVARRTSDHPRPSADI